MWVTYEQHGLQYVGPPITHPYEYVPQPSDARQRTGQPLQALSEHGRAEKVPGLRFGEGRALVF